MEVWGKVETAARPPAPRTAPVCDVVVLSARCPAVVVGRAAGQDLVKFPEEECWKDEEK